jgi:lipid-A-disaccharide synthase-like uncharacterized protein
MTPSVIYGVGFLAQALFSARMLLQWLASEVAGRAVAPASFWWLSIGGAFIMIVYGVLRADIVIIAGQVLLYFIYYRNLTLKQAWPRHSGAYRVLALLLPVLLTAGLAATAGLNPKHIFQNDSIATPLLIWGGIGQVLFSLRFVYQWIISEKASRSTLPLGFWVISVIGCLMLLIYGAFRHDPVLLLGQSFSFIVYGRNIVLCKRVALRSQLP